MPILRWVLVVCVVAALQVSVALADPEPLSDHDLDAVSARGYSVPGFTFGSSPLFTTVLPFAPTSGENDTDINNLVLGFANSTTVNTIVSTCVFADCENGGSSIESSPVTGNQFEISNQVAPSLQNVVSVPTVTNSTVGPPAAPPMAAAQMDPASLAPPMRHGIVRAPPPLPTQFLTINR